MPASGSCYNNQKRGKGLADTCFLLFFSCGNIHRTNSDLDEEHLVSSLHGSVRKNAFVFDPVACDSNKCFHSQALTVRVMPVVSDCHSSVSTSKMFRLVVLKNLHSDLETVDSSYTPDNSIKLEM